MFSFLGVKKMNDPQQQQQQPVDRIYAFWRQLKEEEDNKKKIKGRTYDDDDNDDDVDVESRKRSCREFLESTLVPFLKEELNRIDDEIDKDDSYNDHDQIEEEEEEKKSGAEDSPQPITVILECFRYFVTVPFSSKDDKAFFVTSGAFGETRHVLKQSLLQLATPSAETVLGLEILAHLATDASDALKNDHILSSVPLIHQLMEGSLLLERSLSTSEDSGTSLTGSSSGPSPPWSERRILLQVYGCQILRHLSNPLLQELVVAGSVEVLARAMYSCVDEPLVHEHGNAALYNLLPVRPTTYLLGWDPDHQHHHHQPPHEGDNNDDPSLLPLSLPSIVVRGMQAHPRDWRVQQYGLLVLKRICQKDVEQFEWMASSEGGLSVVLTVLSYLTSGPSSSDTNGSSLSSPPEGENDDEEEATTRECLVQLSCQFLKDLSKPSNYNHKGNNSNDDDNHHHNSTTTTPFNNNQTHHYQMDMIRIIAIKGTLQAMVQVLHRYFNNPNICDPALCCLRNLLTHPETQQQALDMMYYPLEGNTDTALSTIPTIHQCMKAQPQDAAVQAYSLDCLGRLAQSQAAARLQVVSEGHADVDKDPLSSLLATILRAMVTHRSHAGVQDRAVFVLVAVMKSSGRDQSSSSPQGKITTTTTIMEQLEPAFEALQPKWGEHDVFIEDDLQSFFKASKVPPRGVSRLAELSELVRTYYVNIAEGGNNQDRSATTSGDTMDRNNTSSSSFDTTPEKSPRSILSFSFTSLSVSSAHSSPSSPASEPSSSKHTPVRVGNCGHDDHPQQQQQQSQGGTTSSSFFSPQGWKKTLNFSTGG